MKHLTVVSATGAIVILLFLSSLLKYLLKFLRAKVDSSKAPAVRAAKRTKVTFIGVVKGLSDTTILVERTVKGKVELIEFVLDKPTEKIGVGDKVRMSYLKKEGKNIATTVTRLLPYKRFLIKNIPPLWETKPCLSVSARFRQQE